MGSVCVCLKNEGEPETPCIIIKSVSKPYLVPQHQNKGIEAAMTHD